VTFPFAPVIISCNAAVEQCFGCAPDELVDCSVRGLLQFLPKKKGPSMGLMAQSSEGRFSRTEMWKVGRGKRGLCLAPDVFLSRT
jgi:hypothetical protein